MDIIMIASVLVSAVSVFLLMKFCNKQIQK